MLLYVWMWCNRGVSIDVIYNITFSLSILQAVSLRSRPKTDAVDRLLFASSSSGYISDIYLFSVVFLPLLHYVGRAYESQFVRRLSSVVPSMTQLSVNQIQGFLLNFGCCFPWAIRSEVFFNLKKIGGDFYEYFRFR